MSVAAKTDQFKVSGKSQTKKKKGNIKTVVIVEDDPISQELYSEILIPEGYQVINAYNGKEGLNKIEKYDPDLLILDLMIPGIDGRTLLGDLRRINRKLPVIIVSGKTGMKDDPEIKLSTQVRCFLSKPVSIKELVEKVESILGKQEEVPQSNGNQWIGKRVGGCLITECIGKGGGGVVFKGVYGGTEVAIKMLKDILSEEEDIARFRREAQLLARVKHPNIIELLDVGYTREGLHYIITSYFSGVNVENILRTEKRFSMEEFIKVISQVASGIHSAHEVGLIHRDLKPSNFLYDRESGLVKVIDFGIAKEIHTEQQITHHGHVIGTPYYMAPEQCKGQPLDARSDIYSLGVTCYQLLTGDVPFKRMQTMQIFFAHVHEPLYWPARIAHAISIEIQQVIEKMMAKDPKDRYASMLEVSEALLEIQDKHFSDQKS